MRRQVFRCPIPNTNFMGFLRFMGAGGPQYIPPRQETPVKNCRFTTNLASKFVRHLSRVHGLHYTRWHSKLREMAGDFDNETPTSKSL